MLEKLTQSTFAKMAVMGVVLSTATPTQARETETWWVPLEQQDSIQRILTRERTIYRVEGSQNNEQLSVRVSTVHSTDIIQQYTTISGEQMYTNSPILQGFSTVYGIIFGVTSGVLTIITVSDLIEKGEDLAAHGGGALISGGIAYGCYHLVKYSKGYPVGDARTSNSPIRERVIQSSDEQAMPAPFTSFTVSSDYFTSYEDPGLGTASGLHTDSQGNATVQLIPTDPGFAFTQEGITNVVYAQQLRKAGFSSRKYLPLLQQNAAPVQYTVTIQTQATDGENAKLDVPVKGWTVASEAIDRIIMGL